MLTKNHLNLCVVQVIRIQFLEDKIEIVKMIKLSPNQTNVSLEKSPTYYLPEATPEAEDRDVSCHP